MEDFEKKRIWTRRYSRQILVPQFNGITGQRNVSNSSVVVVGAGGIGSTAILYLAGAGVGKIGIVDFDIVEESNLHRQIIHSSSGSDTLAFKAQSARERVLALNPHIECSVILEKITADNAADIIEQFDIVIDATDNSSARYALNRACVALHKPLVSGSAVGMEGQLTVFPNSGGTAACYQCVHPTPSADEACKSCANAGVVGPVPGVIGTLQAVEVLKVLTHPEALDRERGESADKQVNILVGRQLYYDGTSGEFHTFHMRSRRPNCSVCGTGALSSLPQGPAGSPSATSLLALHASLSSEHRVSAHSYWTGVLRAGALHLLLDVRSALQFDMISLQHLLGDSCSSQVLNMPYADMARAESSQVLRKISAALDAICSEQDDSSGVDVYVLCRRGNDSARVTLLLLSCLENSASSDRLRQARLLNIDGGLHAWTAEVDETFPAY